MQTRCDVGIELDDVGEVSNGDKDDRKETRHVWDTPKHYDRRGKRGDDRLHAMGCELRRELGCILRGLLHWEESSSSLHEYDTRDFIYVVGIASERLL